ncbi:protamine-like protein [Scomber scombrus]|uniref:Protamine-like protein n=1 Tax=Scomber scombrus TaxID=13677 RepID=A0AAV1MU47_SCOSC|nr:protamine-like protein [Scomber scombrus]
MSSAVIPYTLSAPAKSPKKRARSQKKKTGPTVSDRILKAVSASSDRGGVSLAALKKALKAGGYDVVKNKARILTAIKRLVINKSLVQIKGTGASGSFKLNKKAPKPKKKVVKKKPKAKKVKKTRAKKAAGATPTKKSPKKKRKAKSPKKAKRPAAVKKPKKPKSPKKTKRKAAKSTRTRGAAKK